MAFLPAAGSAGKGTIKEDRMLVLSRRCDMGICIGSDITIKVLGIQKRQVKLGIEAPSGLSVWREELVPIVDPSEPGGEQRLSRSQQPCSVKPQRRHS